MILIIASIIMGYIGLNIGGMVGGGDISIYLFGIVGILSPGLYVLEQLYKEMKKNQASS